PRGPWRRLRAASDRARAGRGGRRGCRSPWLPRCPGGWRRGFPRRAPAPPSPPRAAPRPLPWGRPTPAQRRPRVRFGRAGPSWRRGRCGAASSGFGQYEVVAMDDHIAATVAEDGRDFTTLVPGDQPYIAARIGRKPACRLGSCARLDDHAIAPVESAVDPDDARRQEALSLAQRARGAVIDDDRAGRADRAGNPRLARGA